jgi:hypothetical protein
MLKANKELIYPEKEKYVFRCEKCKHISIVYRAYENPDVKRGVVSAVDNVGSINCCPFCGFDGGKK